MDLSEKFQMVVTGNVVRIRTIEQDKRYAVAFAQKLHTQYGLSVLLTIRVDSLTNVKVFLPRRYSDVFRDEDIEGINNKTITAHLIYKGRIGSSYVLRLEY